MIFVSSSWRMYLVGLAVSLGIFLVIYFTVIKDANDQVNTALDNANQIEQEQLQNARQQLNQGQQDSSGSANQQLSQAQKLLDCIANVPATDTSAIAQCQSQFGG